MPQYNCELCKFSTHLKSNYTSHISSKKHLLVNQLKTINIPVNAEDNTKTTQEQHSDNLKTTEKTEKVSTDFTCKYCECKFSFRQSMNRHIKYTCTKNKDEDMKELVRLMNIKIEQQKQELQTQSKEIDSQSKKIETQSKQIEKLMGKLDINVSFNTTNNIQNIQLLAYRATDVSHLTDQDYRSCLKKVNHCVKHMIERVHFNPTKPENMNIYISNIKDKYIMVYDGMNWNLANKKDEIDRLYEEKEMMLEEWLESNPEKELKDKFMRYLNNKESDECLNRIKDEIKLMLYNNQKMLELKNSV
jgi:hypothetical protein